jgi:hypothetical protein
VGSETTNGDVAVDEGLHGRNRVALKNRNYQNQTTRGGEGAGVGLIQD